MPTTYAHCRFGEEMLHRMPADVRGTVKRHRPLFDIGLQGPDPLLYYRPVLRGKVYRLGQKFHMQTGRDFFSRVCRNLRRDPNDSGQAYLYGVLCHYVLDASCHPLAVQAENPGQIAMAFDRFLMMCDGCLSTGQYAHMALTDREWGIRSRVYPGTDKRIFRRSVSCMAKNRRILELGEGVTRTARVLTRGRAGQMSAPECTCWNQPMLERYLQAAEIFPEMLLKLIAHLQYNGPLGEKFDPIFG